MNNNQPLAISHQPVEIAWFCPLCDDDYEYLGVPDAALRSSFPHCRDILLRAEANGFDNILCPSGYALGIDSVAFASAVAPLTSRIRLLVAVRCGKMFPPQLARQLATLDRLLDGRLTINIISSDLPGAPLPSAPRYQRTHECMQILRALLNGEPVCHRGEFYQLEIDPPAVRTVSGRSPLFYFGGLSDDARAVAAEEADVFLMWPEPLSQLRTLLDDMRARAARVGRSVQFGYRVHMIVRETEAEARAYARRLVSRLDDRIGEEIRRRSLDHASVGVRTQAMMREQADNEGFVEDHLWTGIGRARSGCGAALVGDPDQVLRKLRVYIDLGISGFILSGYPHASECDYVGRYILPQLRTGTRSGAT
ncbi:MAG: LLM class flavin-dependent oxidoreductase [Deltaproteobacteria bacterium]|nr:LLM class flavin-dependent oxidoreductase [Deltaproteobacteria bacterium]MBI3388831.1 LLM class flavin-dependent oxidoreductase [Deltaproteobacteria bacterium]